YSRQLLSQFRPEIAELTNRGGRKGFFYENKNVSHRKFGEPLAFATLLIPHCARPRLLCACAASASGLSGGLRQSQQEHRSRLGCTLHWGTHRRKYGYRLSRSVF